MKKKVNSTLQRGFTLIELVVVIVILGILAATAIPKFVSLDTDAKNAVLDGAAAAVQGAAVMTYAKNAAAGGGAVTFASVSSNISYDSTKVTIAGPCPSVTLTYSGGSPTKTVTLDTGICNG